MTRSKRLTNFELLRILAMLMIVTMHYLAATGLLPDLEESITPRQIVGAAIESFCIVAVNVYVLLSGYFMVQSGFRVSRILRLICQVLFYALLIPLILYMIGIPIIAGQEGLYGLILYIFPISTAHYWFATEYVCLYLFSPFLNAACGKMSKRQLGLAIGLLLILFSGVKSVVPFSLVTDRFGYDFGWFMCLYLIGGYIRLYGLSFLKKGKRAWLVYGGSAVGIFLLTLGMYYFYQATGWMAHYFKVPFHYNFILCLLGGVGLFYGFSKIQIKDGKGANLIGRMGSLCFGVYLLHMHVDIRDRWYQWIEYLFGSLYELGLPGLVLNMIATVLFVFVSGVVIDYVRSQIFLFVERRLAGTKLAGKVKRWDSF